MDAFTKLVTIFYSGFHKYLKEAGYDLFDLEFIDIYIYNRLKAIFKSSYLIPQLTLFLFIFGMFWFLLQKNHVTYFDSFCVENIPKEIR